MFEEIDISQSARLDFAIPPMPQVLVVDLSLITGMDTSTVDIFGEVRELCKKNDCKLYLCGLSPRQKKAFAKAGIKPDKGLPRSKRTFLFFSDLDSGLGKAEDVLIQEEMETSDVLHFTQPFAGSEAVSGFHVALRHIDELHCTEFANGLLDLEPYTKSLELSEGQFLFEKDGRGGIVGEKDHGLFFIERGMVRVDKDNSDMTLTRTRSYMGTSAMMKLANDNTLKGQHARLGTIARRSALAKRLAGGGQTNPSYRSARMGPGWVIGIYEFASGQPPIGVFRAITPSRLHYIPFSTIHELEETHPILAIRLYKLVSHMMVRKENNTVSQLTTLHNILSSPAHSKPFPRSTAALRSIGR
eukprot:CAMPEP_0178766332 /NCGR_PEP_ID=MMETSP0744-20121128/18999_1 /TAXON_ID=913974 /ORGANISM="Nitzschia punctata, Strain CCMP561" /LENGTH=357 /DNA_ID=CAMNT_0020422029 /DNA_START=22 /DNA_END=1095 /DNA_ORIENTATION=-